MRKLITILLISLVALPVYAGSTSRPYTDGAVEDLMQKGVSEIQADTFYGYGGNLTGIESGTTADTITSQYQEGTVLAGDTIIELTFSVDSQNEVDLYLDGVSQRPSDYVLSDSTTIELGEAPVDDSNYYVKYIGTGSPGVLEGFIEPTGFQLEHADVNGDSVIRLVKGGVAVFNDPESGDRRVFDVGDGDTMDLDEDLIAGTTRQSSMWYELLIAVDRERNLPARLVAIDSGTSIDTQGDLPTDYELFVSLSQPRSGWVRTNSNSNLYTQRWVGDHFLWSAATQVSVGRILQVTVGSSNWQSVNVPSLIPPVESTIQLAGIHARDDGTGSVFFNLSDETPDENQLTDDDLRVGQVIFRTPKADLNWTALSASIDSVENQTFFWFNSNAPDSLNDFHIESISKVEVTGE